MSIDKKLVEKVRGWYHFPPLREPEIVPELEGGAHFDFSTSDTRISEKFVREITERTGLSRDECLEGILTHEIGHYMIFPRTLGTIMLSGKMLDDFFGSRGKEPAEAERKKQNFIFQTFADMTDDTSSVLDGNRRDSILKMRTASQQTIDDEVNKNIRSLMLGYLHRQAGIGYQLEDGLKPYLERMLQIEFLSPENNRAPQDPQKLRLSLFQWGDIVNDLLKQHGASGTPSLDDLSMNAPGDADIDEILKNAPAGEIRRALREVSDKISRGEYKQVREWLKERGVELPDSSPEKPYVTIGTSRGELQVDEETVRYYRELSKEYPLPVHRKPISTEKTKKSFEETEKWVIGKEPLQALPNLSGGMLLPGITRKVRVQERKIQTTDYDIPHLLTVIDSSGSMPNPSDRKSQAVLAAVCAARAYHVQDSAVGVINFSGDSFYLPYTRDLNNALAAIVAYQGGGTSVDMDILKKMLRPEEFRLYEEHPELHVGRVPQEALKKTVDLSLPSFRKALESGSIDLLMFTDGGIGNLEEVLGFFEETNTLHRGTIILTDRYAQPITEKKDGKIRIYHIKDEKDIPNIVIGDVRGNLNYHASHYAAQK